MAYANFNLSCCRVIVITWYWHYFVIMFMVLKNVRIMAWFFFDGNEVVSYIGSI